MARQCTSIRSAKSLPACPLANLCKSHTAFPLTPLGETYCFRLLASRRDEDLAQHPTEAVRPRRTIPQRSHPPVSHNTPEKPSARVVQYPREAVRPCRIILYTYHPLSLAPVLPARLVKGFCEMGPKPMIWSLLVTPASFRKRICR